MTPTRIRHFPTLRQSTTFDYISGHVAHPELGDSMGDEFKIKSLTNEERSFEVTTDADGALWLIVGTDSGFEGLTTLYYGQIAVVLSEVSEE